MSNEKLKPCPFCGGNAAIRQRPYANDAGCVHLAVECKSCDLMFPQANYIRLHHVETVSRELVEIWNTRKGECYE